MKLKNIIILIISVFCIMFYNNNVQAVTEAQKEVGQAVADFAAHTSTNYEKEFVYSSYHGIDSQGNYRAMHDVMGYRKKANAARNTIWWFYLW